MSNEKEINFIGTDCSFSVNSKEAIKHQEINNNAYYDDYNTNNAPQNDNNLEINESYDSYYSQILVSYHIKHIVIKLKSLIKKRLITIYHLFFTQFKLSNNNNVCNLRDEIKQSTSIIISLNIKNKITQLKRIFDLFEFKTKLIKFKSWRETVIRQRLKVKFEEEALNNLDKKYSKKLNLLRKNISQVSSNIENLKDYNSNFDSMKNEFLTKISHLEKENVSLVDTAKKLENTVIVSLNNELTSKKQMKERYLEVMKEYNQVESRLNKENSNLKEKNQLIIAFINSQMDLMDSFEKNLAQAK